MQLIYAKLFKSTHIYAIVKPFAYRVKHHNPRLKKRLSAQSLQGIRFLFVQLVKFFSNKQTQRIVIYSLTGLLFVSMLLWNWQIVLATSTGIGIMALVYLLQTKEISWRFWQAFLSGSNLKLLIAVLSGGFAALSTYLAASVWTDSENRWLALGSILQGLGTLITLSLLSWYILGQNNRSCETKLENYLADLTHQDPLKRLIALHYLANNKKVNYPLTEHYRLMLTIEEHPLVRDALLEILAQAEQPLQIPLKIRQKIPS